MTPDPNPRTAAPAHMPTHARIRWYRKNIAHVTQEQLGAAVGGYSADTVRAWESGKRQVRTPVLLDLADYFGVTTEDLTGGAAQRVPGQPRRHPSANAILGAMVGTHAAAPHADAGDVSRDAGALWRVWKSSAPDTYAIVGHGLPTMLARAEATVASLPAGPGRRDAYAGLASLYQLAGSYLRAVGAIDLGMDAASRGRAAATAADQPAALAAATWWQAAILSSSRHTAHALHLAQSLAATDLNEAGPERAAVIGQAQLLGAIQAVRLRRPEVAENMLALAGQIIARTPFRDVHNTGFGRINLLIHQTAAFTEAGKYRMALAVADTFDASAIGMREREVAHTVTVAFAHVASDNTAGAVAALGKAVAVSARETASGTLGWDTLDALELRRAGRYTADLERIRAAMTEAVAA